jgi:Zn-dependent protease with chaperone function
MLTSVDESESPVRQDCPGCQAEVLVTERYCPRCGEDLRWKARPRTNALRIPRALDVAQFQLAADRSAARALALAAPVQTLVRYYLRRIAEPEYRNQLLGNALRVSPTQAPRVHRLARHCERILHTAPVEVYVSTSSEAAAFAFGSGETDVIVITSALVDFLPKDDQLLFVLGQQLGHVKADHVLYLTIAKALGTALKGIPALGSALSSAANFLLVPWQRMATLTADRAGLLCCQDLRTAALTITKMTLGYTKSIAAINFDEFLAQAKHVERTGDWGDTWKPVPALGRRLRNLEDYLDSVKWATIFEGSWDPLAPRFACFYCSGGAAPTTTRTRLDRLACSDCGRDLMVEEVPCPACCAPVPVAEANSLDDLECPACETSYLDETRAARYRGDLGEVARARSAYSTLGVSPSAPPARLRRAFRERMAPLENRVAGVGGADPVPQKIRLYAAFKTLIDPARRAAHDRLLEHAALLENLDIPAPEAPCRRCGAARRGPHCGLCGHDESRQDGPSSPLPEIEEALRRAAGDDVGELHVDPMGPFALAFHTDRRSLLIRRCEALDRPGAIRDLLRAASDVAAALRPAVQAEVFAIVEGAIDEELLERILSRTPGTPRYTLSLVRRGPDGHLDVGLPADIGTPEPPERFDGVEAWIHQLLELD